MIKYEIVGKFPDSSLINMCISILSKNGITELPALAKGEKKALFKNEHTKISLESNGDRTGCFVLFEQNDDYTALWTSTTFKY